jgi:hypothetical protein
MTEVLALQEQMAVKRTLIDWIPAFAGMTPARQAAGNELKEIQENET